jgi:ABC-type nitrate/sulfonate/bicarbonate transport system permease component
LWIDGLIGVVGVLVLWQLLATTVLAGSRVVPPPLAVVAQLWQDRDSYPANVSATLRVALIGYVWGNLIAILLGVLCDLVPAVETPVLRLAIACFNIPLVAIAPILIVVLPEDGPKIALAALSVFFTTLIATGLGLRAADPTSLDVVRAAGGGAWMDLRKVKGWAALPSILGGLRVAAPAALLGAIIGEYLGTQEGLGAAMIQAQSSFAVARTWGIALVVAALAGLLYLGATALAHLLTPWASQTVIGLGSVPDQPSTGGRWRRLAHTVAFLAASLGLLLAVWYGLIRLFNLNPFFAKDPDDVFRFLVSGPGAEDHRAVLLDALGRTVSDAAGGYLVGTLAATVVAMAVVLSRGIEQAVMPVAITLRSVPLVAMTPLIALIFGRGYLGVTAVVSIVTFFPTLVNVAVGLRSAPALACDLVRVSGGSPLMVMRKVRLPYAVPAFFASVRIAAPAAIGGATLAEWLATGTGLGNVLVISYSASDFNTLWSGAVLIVTVSVTLYGFVGLIEGWVSRWLRHG